MYMYVIIVGIYNNMNMLVASAHDKFIICNYTLPLNEYTCMYFNNLHFVCI